MNAYLYCDKRSLNYATNYYVSIIKDVISDFGYTFKTVHSLGEIKKASLIVTITERYFFLAKLRHPNIKTIYWAQGVGAEEAKVKLATIGQKLRYYFRLLSEPIAVKKANLLFCVSERMVKYFEEEYGLRDKGQIMVMPCYNLPLSPEFSTKQYEQPVFAYAGNAMEWQGIDFMLDVYSIVEKSVPRAKLKLFTRDKAAFEEKLQARNITSYEFNYVPVDVLQKELHQCKYGFIIRDNIIINLVATPTKMNSYLAAYMIPIFSDGVDDFKMNINLGEYTIMATCPIEAKAVASKIVSFENKVQDFKNYQDIVKTVFESHYSDANYKKFIKEKFIQYIQ